MDTPRTSPSKPGSKQVLWAGVAVVVIIVLSMGAALLRLQAQPQEPRLVVLPALEAPPSPAPPVVASATTEPARSAASLPPATSAPDPLVDTPKPRIVQPRTSEPAVARVPQRVASKPDAAEGETAPDINR